MRQPMEYGSSPIGWHNRGIFKTAVELAELGWHECVLDFGCYTQFLKNFIPMGCGYVGYDINPDYTGVKDYRNLRGIDVVFALNVLEHMVTVEALRSLLADFRAIGAKRLVVALPTESIPDLILRAILNREAELFFKHTLASKTVATELVKEFGVPLDCRRFHMVQFLGVFEVK